jgi:hypothetical protein
MIVGIIRTGPIIPPVPVNSRSRRHIEPDQKDSLCAKLNREVQRLETTIASAADSTVVER